MCFSTWCQPAGGKLPLGPSSLWPGLCSEHHGVLQTWYVFSASCHAFLGNRRLQSLDLWLKICHSDCRGNPFFPLEVRKQIQKSYGGDTETGLGQGGGLVT
jgi:hypothetical protein